jgi:exonuclease III
MRTIVFSALFFLSQLCAADFDYYPGKGKETHLDKEGKIKILTWNILGLPNERVSIHPWEERIDGIAKTILSSNADVVILQECFEKDLSLGLYERLKNDYAHAYLNLSGKTTLFPSGLALFSKVNVAQFRFTPHNDLLDTERSCKMGTIDFVVLNNKKKPVAHIAGCHFQGSSGCEWRISTTEAGQRLSYVAVRDQEALAAIGLEVPDLIPHYLCGDLNVDRRAKEFSHSSLNTLVNPNLTDRMTPIQRMIGTNTSFLKHKKGLSQLYPNLSQEKILSLAIEYRKFYEENLSLYLNKDPWNKPLSEFKHSFFSELEKKIDLSSPDKKLIWDYFKTISLKVIVEEKKLWKDNYNPGDAPNVSIGRLLENRVVIDEEAVDFILGVNPAAIIYDIQILTGYVYSSMDETYSDHHPLLAIIRVAEASKTNSKSD